LLAEKSNFCLVAFAGTQASLLAPICVTDANPNSIALIPHLTASLCETVSTSLPLQHRFNRLIFSNTNSNL